MLAALKKVTSRWALDARIDVGFTAPHAIFIHEFRNPKTLGLGVPRRSGIGEYWGPPQHGPKYLENAIAEFREELRQIIRKAKEKIPVEYGSVHPDGTPGLRDSGVAKVVRGGVK